MLALLIQTGGAAAQSITFSKTASPTTYAAAGQVITYTYFFNKTSSFTAFLTNLTDDKVAPADINCPTNAIPGPGTLTCTGTYTTTLADVANGNLTNNALATIDTCGDDCFEDFPASATVTLISQPSWTLAKSPSPSTYSAAGQSIIYSYVLANTGSVSISAISLTDNKIAPVNCPATTLAVGASMTCTGTYLTTAADVAAGSVVNTATATGTPTSGTLAPVTAQATITIVRLNGSITIVKLAIGGSNTFNFTSTIATATSFTMTTAGGTATRSFTDLTAGTYTFTEVNLPLNWSLSALTCAGDNGGAPTTVNVTARSVSIGLDGGESIVCVFTNVFNTAQHIQQTQAVIQRFLSHRLNLLANDEPDRPRFLRRVPGSLWGEPDSGGGAGAPDKPFNFSGSSSALGSQMAFAMSLSQAEAYARAREDEARLAAASGRLYTKAPPLQPRRFDAWIEAHFNEYNANSGPYSSKGHFNILYAGADYLVTRAILVGALVQFDWTSEAAAAAVQGSASGFGAMAGPYASVRITPNLYFDTRVAWGQSDNRVNPFGSYQDKFSTDRWLAHAKLTGNWWSGNFRITPSAAVTYIEENQHSYTDSLGILIPNQTVALGRLAVGPELAYRIIGNDGTTYEPHVQIRGMWDFVKPNATTTVGGFIVSNDTFHAQVQGGVLTRFPSGYALRVVGQYDGIGSSNFHSYGGQIWLNVPLKGLAPK